jgi:predicted amidohydrolase YtcJ
MREAHAHLAQHGRAMSMLQLASCTSVEDCLNRCHQSLSRSDCALVRTSNWLLGVGLRIESWPNPRYPTLAELDDATGDTPACLWSFDHHALILNSAALRALGITGHTPDPDHGRIARDERNRPTGLMLERAAKYAWERIPEPSPAEWRQMVKSAAHELASLGFTEVHDLLTQPWLPAILADLDSAGELPIAVHLFPLLPDLGALLATRNQWERHTIRLAGAKLFADGTLNSRTAFMLEPYADPLADLPRGQQMLSRDDLTQALHRTTSHQLTLAVHAIGDAAVRTCLDAAESCFGGTGHAVPPRGPCALRIEHAELIHEQDIPRFRALNVAASLQPCHLLADIEVLTRALPHRLHRVLPIKDLIASGLTPGHDLLFGSDTPIVRPHPQDSIQAAVHRRRKDTPPIAPEQAISEAQAWSCFSRA